MRKFVIFVVVIVAAASWFKHFVRSGQLERYLDTHPNEKLNPAIEYFWGISLSLAGKKESASYRFLRIVQKYQKSEYAPGAWVEYIEMLDSSGNRPKVLEESKKFLESDYASHPKAEFVKKKIKFIEHGY